MKGRPCGFVRVWSTAITSMIFCFARNPTERGGSHLWQAFLERLARRVAPFFFFLCLFKTKHKKKKGWNYNVEGKVKELLPRLEFRFLCSPPEAQEKNSRISSRGLCARVAVTGADAALDRGVSPHSTFICIYSISTHTHTPHIFHFCQLNAGMGNGKITTQSPEIWRREEGFGICSSSSPSTLLFLFCVSDGGNLFFFLFFLTALLVWGVGPIHLLICVYMPWVNKEKRGVEHTHHKYTHTYTYREREATYLRWPPKQPGVIRRFGARNYKAIRNGYSDLLFLCACVVCVLLGSVETTKAVAR